MNVIELNIDFSIKIESSTIEKIMCNAYKEDENGDLMYKRRIKKEWGSQAKQIQAINHQKYLVAYDEYSDRKYFLFRNIENACVNGRGQLRCIIISSEDHKDCEKNIALVIKRIQEVLEDKVSININYDSSCKLYICNKEAHDIVSSSFYLKAKLSKEKIWDLKKGKIKFVIIVLVLAIIMTFLCWNQISEYANSLSLAHEENAKAIISAKISILVNLFTGIYGTIIVEVLMLLFEVIVIVNRKRFTFKIDYDITKNNVEEFNRKGLMHAVGDDLEQELDITSDV